MVLHYKCPNCGSDMVFDSESGTLSCGSCGRKDNVDSFPKEFVREEQEAERDGRREFTPSEYHCQNCGAVLITDADTAATTCGFCGAGVVLADRLSGQLAPAKVIPFTISRQQAEEAYKKWSRKKLLTPKKFRNADRIKSLTGIYVPFWLYDLNSKSKVHASCTKVRTYSQGDYIYTETKHFNVYRGIDLNYVKIPADASEKMDDKLMDRLEPYDYGNLKEFNMPYLTGFLAEKYNYDDKELFPRIRERAVGYTNQYISGSINGYSSVHITSKDIQISQNHAYYTLLPVWMLNYDYENKDYIFAMNGQTGKIVGKPPLSGARMVMWFFIISGFSFLAIRLILLLGGVIL